MSIFSTIRTTTSILALSVLTLATFSTNFSSVSAEARVPGSSAFCNATGRDSMGATCFFRDYTVKTTWRLTSMSRRINGSQGVRVNSYDTKTNRLLKSNYLRVGQYWTFEKRDGSASDNYYIRVDNQIFGSTANFAVSWSNF